MRANALVAAFSALLHLVPTPSSAQQADGVAGANIKGPTAAASAAPTPDQSSPPTAAPVASKPKTLTPPAAEIAYRAKLAAMLEPLLAPKLSPEDIKRLKDSLKDRTPGAVSDPVQHKLVQWQILKSGIGEPGEFLAFASANPAWPDAQLMVRRAEEQLFARGGSAAAIKVFFNGREPATGAGFAALASAHLAENDEAGAKRLAAKAWTDLDMAATFESGFLERFGKFLTPADHKRRLDRILVDRIRFKGPRQERAAIARRVIPLLPEGDRTAATARLAVFMKDKSVGQKLAALPAESAGPTDWGLAYARTEHLLAANRLDDAAKILIALPTDAESLVSPDDWWLARREAAFASMKAGNAEQAYALVKTSGPLSVNPLKEQSHMAGWIALRLLAKPDVALQHFDVALKAADGPLSRARSAYWAARTLEALGRNAEAANRYSEAMRDPDTFHGLLARHRSTGGTAVDLPIAMPVVPSQTEVRRFLALDAVQAAVVAKRANLDPNFAIGLFAALRNYLQTEGELALLAELAASLGDPQTSLRVGKAAIAKGKNLLVYAYPIDPFPEYSPLRSPPETAFLLSIARQETEFNHTIVSTAGARGLLQVMPVTAKHVCVDHKLKCDVPRLLTDNAYNAQIASAYIGDRMVEFGGWYTVTLAGYNAGPGRARQWIRENGDPRAAGVDPIDWMERIPIEETRHYVEKVLANLQVYRARLGEPKPLRLELDLSKATGLKRAATAQ